MSADTKNHSGTIDNKEVTLQQPVPDSLKYGAIGLLALLLIVVVWLFISSDDEVTTQALVDIENTEQTPEIAAEKGIQLQSSAYDPLNTTGSIKPVTDFVAESNLALVSRTTETEQKLTKLEDQLTQLISQNNSHQLDQDQLIEELQAQLTAQGARIKQLQAHAKVRQRTVKTKKKSVKSFRKFKPLFTLVSIDQWGNDLYAVVRSQGQLYEFTREQGMKGWYVHSFDRSRKAVVFKNRAGTRRELVVKS